MVSIFLYIFKVHNLWFVVDCVAIYKAYVPHTKRSASISLSAKKYVFMQPRSGYIDTVL